MAPPNSDVSVSIRGVSDSLCHRLCTAGTCVYVCVCVRECVLLCCLRGLHFWGGTGIWGSAYVRRGLVWIDWLDYK